MSSTHQQAEKRPGQNTSKSSDLSVRLRTGLFYAIYIIAGAMLGNIGTLVLVTVTAGITAWEFFFMMSKDEEEEKLPSAVLGTLGSIAFPPTIFFAGAMGALIVLAALLIGLSIWYVFRTGASISDMALSLFNAIYTGFSLSSILVMRVAVTGYMSVSGVTDLSEACALFTPQDLQGGLFVIFLFTAITLNDGMAYVFGHLFGKHKLSPVISPKKTWEGFIGGLLCSTAVWCALMLFPSVTITWWQCLLFGVLTAVAGVFGDLLESRFKRSSGVKDSGNIMPGHGGLLDRMDSVFLYGLTAAGLLIFCGCLPIV